MSSERIVPGFRFGGATAGIKASGKPDLALLLADEEVHAAAVFTRNRVPAAPVVLSRERVRGGRARGVLVNSGNANACTGEAGMEAAVEMARAVAEVARPAVDDRRLLVASTGIIGVPLPVGKILAAREALVAATRPDGFDDFAQAILTTDKGPKIAETTVALGNRTARIVGCCKGAGMIAPNMATTLGFVVTDAAVKRRFLRAALAEAADQSFNEISVDGDTSTNDSLFLFASGRLDNKPLGAGGDEASGEAFRAALSELLRDLASHIVADGEGATHVVTIHVEGAVSRRGAEAVARRIGASPLVKAALFGADPNWGRIVAAVGNAGVEVDPARIDVRVGDVPLVKGGVGVEGTRDAAHAVMKQPRYDLHVHLHKGRGSGRHVTCDLTHEYVRINAEYST
jgi:glutamate N-acetyltransferase/amino-acid N-acetyltransferase